MHNDLQVKGFAARHFILGHWKPSCMLIINDLANMLRMVLTVIFIFLPRRTSRAADMRSDLSGMLRAPGHEYRTLMHILMIGYMLGLFDRKPLRSLIGIGIRVA